MDADHDPIETPRRRSRSRHRNRHGVVLIWVALIVLMLVAFIGLAIDVAWGFVVADQLQNAADAGALAGADIAPFDSTQAVTDATNATTSNTAAGAAVQLAASDVQIGNYNDATKTFTVGGTPTIAAKVTARRTAGSPAGPLNLLFGPIFGVNNVDVQRYAIATNRALKSAILLLSPNASPSLNLNGTGSVKDKVNITGGGALVIDSSSSTGVQWTGNPYISAGELDVHGNDTAVTSGSGGVFPTGTLNLQAPTVPDPLASLPPPSMPTGGSHAANSPPFSAGYYPNGITKGGVMGPGIYYIDNGIQLSGNDFLDGSAGVLIYLHTGGIQMGGNTSIRVSPMTSTIYAGISFYEDRSNSSSVTLRGTTGQSSYGTFYFPAAQVTLQGTPDAYAGQIIANTMVVAGDAQVNVNWNGGFPNYRHAAYLVK